MIVVGSLEELRKLSGHKASVDLHRPGIDKIEIHQNGKTYKRIEEVFDCWFESGSMPYGQDHYPFENKQEFDDSFPAEFVVEAIEQVHLWFYTLHVLATALFDRPAYKNVMGSGLMLGEDGRKLSKRLRNYAPPEEIFDSLGADTLRMFILSSPLMNAGDVRLSQDALKDVHRNLFASLQNCYGFYSMYAKVDGFKPGKKLARPTQVSELDKWMLARLDQTIAEMTNAADRYQLQKATTPLFKLLDDLSNWYIRRSRRRFWKSDNDTDKKAAYQTLHFCLLTITQLLAPWAPFLSDELYRKLTVGMVLPESVHLSDWPKAVKVDEKILETMALVRQVVNEGLAQRAEAGIKVRQPLESVDVALPNQLDPQLQDIIAEELNVKAVSVTKSDTMTVTLNTKLTDELKAEGLARELIRHIQQGRKEAGLEVENHILLTVAAPDAQAKQLQAHAKLIAMETLADQLDWNKPIETAHHKTATIDGDEYIIGIQISKAS
jgi:isoleucyl-tRNA synthetase